MFVISSPFLVRFYVLTLLSNTIKLQFQHVINMVIAFRQFMFIISISTPCLSYHCSDMCFSSVMIIVQFYSILYVHYLSSTNTYSTLHLLLMQVQVPSFHVTYRSIPYLSSVAFVVSPHPSRTIDMFISFCFQSFIFSISQIQQRHVPGFLVRQRLSIRHSKQAFGQAISYHDMVS